MYLHEWGRLDDVPLVFWHALGGTGADLAAIAPVLASSGFRVFALDGPGFGRTPMLPAEEYRLDALVGLLDTVLERRRIERPVLMGHSWGGGVAVRYAGAHPDDVRALVLLDSGHLDYVDLPGTAGDLAAAPPIDARGRALHGLADRVSGAWPVIAEHEIPTLLLLATEPPHGDVNREHTGRFEAAVPQADVRWLEGAGHGVLDDVGPQLGEDIAVWLVEQGL
jgi:pimeloyl-ACP methyl ester carboxylesterase